MPSRRAERVASRIKFLASQILQREISDPRLGFVTVLGVELTEDLREASIRLSVLGGEGERSKCMHALEDARGYIQKRIGRNLRLRSTPTLRFTWDDAQDRMARLEHLIRQTKSSGDEPGPDDVEESISDTENSRGEDGAEADEDRREP